VGRAVAVPPFLWQPFRLLCRLPAWCSRVGLRTRRRPPAVASRGR